MRRALAVLGGILLVAAWWWWPRPATRSVPESPSTRTHGAEAPPKIAGAAMPDAPTPSDDSVQCETLGLDARYPTTVEELHSDNDTVVAEHRVRWDDEAWLSFTPEHALGVGVLRSRNFEPKAFAWAEGSCLTLLELTPTPAALVIVEATGQPVSDDEIMALVTCEGEGGRRIYAG